MNRYRVSLLFDMSYGSVTRRREYTMVTKTPRTALGRIRAFGHMSRGRFIPGSRLIEAIVRKIEEA